MNHDDDDELLAALGDALAPPDRPVPADGLAAVRARAAAASASQAPDPDEARGASRRTVLVGSIAAAVGAVAGIAGAVVATSGSSDGDAPGGGTGEDETAAVPTRPVDFTEVPEGTTVAGRTIDHTWGMELLLDIDGLPADRDYAVRYATSDGSLTVSAGGFRSVAVPMACRFNGTALRDAVKEITIVDQRSGRVVLRGRPA